MSEETAVVPVDSTIEEKRRLRELQKRLGVYNGKRLVMEAGEQATYIVDGLIREPSVNILIGDSNLGKTPWAISLGIAVASGTPFLGRRVRQGRVLYADTESGLAEFRETALAVSRHAGLPGIPEEFMVWSPEWQERGDIEDIAEGLIRRVELLKPTLVILDPLRTFWPKAETKTEEAAAMLKRLRQTRVSWLILHHRRKTSQEFKVGLADDTRGWFQDSCGSFALINHTDTRLGVEPAYNKGDAALVFSGFVRGHGPLAPLYLGRDYDEDGDPVGYRRVEGLDYLSEKQREAFRLLPKKFRFRDVKLALGNSDSNAKNLIDRAVAVGKCKKVSKGLYEKTDGEDGASLQVVAA